MQNPIRKAICILLAALILLTFAHTPVSAAPGSAESQDPAILNIYSASPWAQEYILKAIGLGLVPEVLQAEYTQVITRAEFAALAVALYESRMGIIRGRVIFADTFDPNVEKLAYVGIVEGIGDNTFNPNGQLNREQAATFLARLSYAMGHQLPDAGPTFADNNAISGWAYDSVGQIQFVRIIVGTGDNIFSPQAPFTREQGIIALLRLHDQLR